MEFISVCLALGLSLVGHLAQFAYLRRLKRRHAAAFAEYAKKRSLSVDATELLQDLVSQGAVVRIERINPDNLFMWRPT